MRVHLYKCTTTTLTTIDTQKEVCEFNGLVYIEIESFCDGQAANDVSTFSAGHLSNGDVQCSFAMRMQIVRLSVRIFTEILSSLLRRCEMRMTRFIFQNRKMVPRS